MRILLTNDDGVNAEGLAVLERIAAALSDDVWICAPESERSGAEEIWVANADGSQPVQLTTFGLHAGSPDWSPDGRWEK